MGVWLRDDGDAMTLTAKQEAFAQAVCGGMNQSDAYRSAYNAEAMKAETIQSKASILMTDGKVRARVDELREELANKSLWTREQSVQVLKEVVDASDAKHSDKIASVKVLNEMQGFNAPVKTENKTETVTRIELVAMSGNSKD